MYLYVFHKYPEALLGILRQDPPGKLEDQVHVILAEMLQILYGTLGTFQTRIVLLRMLLQQLQRLLVLPFSLIQYNELRIFLMHQQGFLGLRQMTVIQSQQRRYQSIGGLKRRVLNVHFELSIEIFYIYRYLIFFTCK